MFFSRKANHMKMLAELLANGENREFFLGMKASSLPTPEQIRTEAAKLARYSDSKDYLVFAEEAWSRVLSHLDAILNDRTTYEQVQYHRGALKETLDLLRVSYTARAILDSEVKQDASLQR